jgi:hypothetical protein
VPTWETAGTTTICARTFCAAAKAEAEAKLSRLYVTHRLASQLSPGEATQPTPSRRPSSRSVSHVAHGKQSRCRSVRPTKHGQPHSKNEDQRQLCPMSRNATGSEQGVLLLRKQLKGKSGASAQPPHLYVHTHHPSTNAGCCSHPSANARPMPSPPPLHHDALCDCLSPI